MPAHAFSATPLQSCFFPHLPRPLFHSCFPPLLSPQDLAVMMFSVDESKGKVLVYAGVPDEAARRGLVVLDWLRAALVPVEGKGGGGKGGVAPGQVRGMPRSGVSYSK